MNAVVASIRDPKKSLVIDRKRLRSAELQRAIAMLTETIDVLPGGGIFVKPIKLAILA